MAYTIGGEAFNFRRVVWARNRIGDLQDFQVQVELFEDFDWDNVKSDGSDIRFGDGTNKFPYWIEQWNYGSYAKIWVRVPSIPATSLTSFYMYYGNPNAQSESDPASTFDWYDDASTDKSSNYEVVDLYNQGINTSIAYDSSNKRYKISCGGDTDGIVVKGLTLDNAEIEIHAIAEPSSANGGNQQIGAVVRYSSAGVYYLRLEEVASPDNLSIMKQLNPPTTNETKLADMQLTTDAQDGDIIIIKAWAYGSNLGMWYGKENATLTVKDSDLSSGQWGVWAGFDDGSYFYVNFVRIRKYAEKEPETFVGPRESSRGTDPIRTLSPVRELVAKRVITLT